VKPSSRKGKGRRLQNFLKEELYKYFPSLREGDIKTAVMGESGEDIILSPAARDLIPFSFECKNQERLNIWESLTQAEENSNNYTPAVVFKRNRTKTYITLELEEFLKIIGELNE
tara:strand:+ start:1781 stop:2125 length:345 start_codon:yes stop_codon:yes gene_type:complete